jgi:hypothetical protein
MQFMRGDGADHTFAIPAYAWTAGGKLFFAAKPLIDDDATDAAAVISGSWDDTAVTDITVNGVAYKRYACHFPAVAVGVLSAGADSMDLVGEFQFVPSGGDPVTFPGPGDDRIPVNLAFDVKRKTV